MKKVEKFSDAERERLRALVISADNPALRSGAGSTVVTVEFVPLELVHGRSVIGSTSSERLDVVARKKGRSWFIDVRRYGQQALLESFPVPA